jgi:hypothetical protein
MFELVENGRMVVTKYLVLMGEFNWVRGEPRNNNDKYKME